MQIFGKYEKNYQQVCAQFVNERDRFMKELATVPFLRVLPSQANYFLCEVLPPYNSRKLTTQLLEQFNILIKDCSSKESLAERSFIYIAVQGQDENTTLIDTLKTLCTKEA